MKKKYISLMKKIQAASGPSKPNSQYLVSNHVYCSYVSAYQMFRNGKRWHDLIPVKMLH